ncbi:MAG: AMP-binding protein, partial [Acidobacteriota bacterium]
IAAAGPIDAAALRAWCQLHLSPHMVPAAYVPLTEWPRTRNDKLDLDQLPLPDFDTAAARSEYVAPSNERQRLLADIWASALRVARVGIHDDFFALGGDSILSLDVLARMRKHGLESTVPELYRHHTVAELADVVREAADAAGGVAPFALPFAMLCAADRARLPSGIDDAYPLSQLQAGMLFEEQLHAEDALYHDIFSFHLRLPFDESAWSQVLQDAVDRNATLRTAFDLTHFSEPLQLVRSKASVNVMFEDVTCLSNEEQERRIAGIVSTERNRRFDYAAPPLLRFYLLKRAEDRTQVVFGFHHAILDGWSVAVLFSSVLSSYISLSPLDAPAAVRYADYVADERTALVTDEAFWKKIVADLPATTLPRREDGVNRDREVIALPVPISFDVSEGLVQAARLAGVPLKTTLLAAHLRVLGALTGMSEAVSGVVTNARPEHPGSDRVLGLFLNTLPVRATLAPGTFIDLVKRTFDAEQQMLQHRRYPMAAVKRLAGGRTLFDAAFNFVHFHVYQEVMQTAGLEVLQHQVWEETEFPFLAQFSVYPGTSRVELTLIYDSSQFDAEQIQHIAGFYQRSLELRDGSLLPAGEVALLEEWGRRRAYDEAPRLDHWFEEQVRRDPSRIALRCEGEELSYGDLDARANRLAHHLRSLGVQCEFLVGLCLARSLDLVAGILGILKAGAAYVPLDPSYPLNRLRFIIDDSRVAVVVTRSLHAHLLGDAPLVCLDTDASAIGAQPSSPPKFERHIDDAAYVIYTSGSTGQPKGVVVTHANVARLMRATEALFDFGESDVWTLFHSCAFDFSVWEMWGALLYGGRVVVVPYTTSRTPLEFHRLLVSEGVTVLNQTPSAFYQLMEYPAPPSLRCVIFGGEALDVTRLRGWFARHGDERPRMINMYGITETTVHVTYHRV